jgi:Cu/Ag efflux pump CusA
VVLISLALSIWGFRVLGQMPLDVFPNFAPPQVEIQVDAEGLAPEEVESLVTRPIESAINGTPGLTSLRSSSAVGIASVKAVFGWDIDIYRARQLVTERLQRVNSLLPKGVKQPEFAASFNWWCSFSSHERWCNFGGFHGWVYYPVWGGHPEWAAVGRKL